MVRTVKSRLTLHQHMADRAGLHWDLRILAPNGRVQSFAIPKHKVPEGNTRVLAIQTHESGLEALSFQGVIDDGYGKGEIRILQRTDIQLLEYSPQKIQFIVEQGSPLCGKYYLVKTKDKEWIFGKSRH